MCVCGEEVRGKLGRGDGKGDEVEWRVGRETVFFFFFSCVEVFLDPLPPSPSPSSIEVVLRITYNMSYN